ncbi:MAG: hypothetical protein L0220_01500 [Acidobacteria bacterium]|nr:hypothetical protein [Acidobacteriota bacterium]
MKKRLASPFLNKLTRPLSLGQPDPILGDHKLCYRLAGYRHRMRIHGWGTISISDLGDLTDMTWRIDRQRGGGK